MSNISQELKGVIYKTFKSGKVQSNSGYGYYLHYYNNVLYCDHVSSGLIGGFYIENKDYGSIENIYQSVKHFICEH